MAEPVATWALVHPFVVTRAWAAVLSAAVLVALVLLTHALVATSTAAQVTTMKTSDASQAHAIWRRRGVKSLIIGSDGRASTSKTQVVLWTFAVFYAFVFLLIWGRSIGCPDDPGAGSLCAAAANARAAFVDVTTGPLQHEYYALLGLPVVAAVAAKSMTVSSLAEGRLHQDAIEPAQSGVVDALSEIVGTDDGQTDLIDFQYFAFTLLALAYFLTEFLAAPGAGLPDIPPTLVALSGVSTGAYTAKKALSRTQPVVTEGAGS